MDEEIETLVLQVRTDRTGFAREVEAMRAELEGPLALGAERAGRRIESGLLRAARTGKFGFEDLRRIALSVMDEIAASALRSAAGGGLLALGTSLLGSLAGLPGRSTGGPVAPGRAYVVGERGPELFVPTASGQVVASPGGARDVRVSIAVQGRGENGDARLLARSARQVARAVRGALNG